MDADEDEPLGRPSAVGGGDQTIAGTTTTPQGQTGSHPTDENESEQERRPDGPAATAADVALEQDA